MIPILRAGLILLERAETVLPASQTFHIGYVRNEETLEASCYLNKLPPAFSPDDLIIITDPMLATGGTIVKVRRRAGSSSSSSSSSSSTTTQRPARPARRGAARRGAARPGRRPLAGP